MFAEQKSHPLKISHTKQKDLGSTQKKLGFLQNPHFQSYTPLTTHRVSLRWRAWRAQAVRVWLNQIDTALRSVAATSLADW